MMTTDNFCFYLQNRLIQTSQKKEVNGTVIFPPLVFPGTVTHDDPTTIVIFFKVNATAFRFTYHGASPAGGTDYGPSGPEFS
jgi:hypothetical protein